MLIPSGSPQPDRGMPEQRAMAQPAPSERPIVGSSVCCWLMDVHPRALLAATVLLIYFTRHFVGYYKQNQPTKKREFGNLVVL